MIGYLTGRLISVKPTSLTLDVNGVGYVVSISINTFEKLNGKESASLFIHTHVREDAISLYGFAAEAEKEMFELLISISGIGPKMGLSILSGISVDELKHAIASSDVSRIIAVPGVGRKTAERLMLELKSKVESISVEGEAAGPFDIKNEAVAALITLGYNSKVAEKVVRDVLSTSPKLSIEDLIRRALSLLNV
jgi:Holliday junction DNA helicase RuvA